jgi:GntR family histidine utilization transcriptional repressor
MSLPLHERIRSGIEAEILSGALKPGDRLPTEHALMAEYGCARMTVSKALSALAVAGLIDRRKRAGSFVARPKMHSMVLDIPDLRAEVERRGQAYRYAMVRRSVRAPHPARPGEVALAGKGRLLKIEGVHHADDRPLAVEERLISLAAVPEIGEVDFQEISPGAWLLRHVPWTEAELRVAAVAAEGIIASRLWVPLGTPCLMVERRTWRSGEGITLVRQHFSGADYDLVARFGPASSPKSAIRSST